MSGVSRPTVVLGLAALALSLVTLVGLPAPLQAVAAIAVLILLPGQALARLMPVSDLALGVMRPGARPGHAHGGVHDDVLPRRVVMAGGHRHDGRHHHPRVHCTRTAGGRKMIDLAGLLATAALLVTLVGLEVRRAGPDTGQPARPKLLGRTLSRGVVAVMWGMYVLLLIPRVLGLLA